jgi:hypothetical protein
MNVDDVNQRKPIPVNPKNDGLTFWMCQLWGILYLKFGYRRATSRHFWKGRLPTIPGKFPAGLGVPHSPSQHIPMHHAIFRRCFHTSGEFLVYVTMCPGPSCFLSTPTPHSKQQSPLSKPLFPTSIVNSDNVLNGLKQWT